MQALKIIAKRAFWGILLCLAIISFPLPSLGVTLQEIPNPRQVYGGWVADTADVLTPEVEVKLNQMISTLEADNSSEIAVVTVADTTPFSTPKQFTTELFNYWGIGKKEQNNGVLLLISQGERRVEIEIGYGLEKILTKPRIRSIIYKQIIPHFQQGDFSGGTLAGTQALITNLSSGDFTHVTNKALHNGEAATSNLFFSIVGILILGCGWGIYIALRVPVLEPVGKTYLYNSAKDGAAKCANCNKAMEKLNTQILLSYLTPAQQVAQKIGSVSFDGWRCPNCQPQLTREGFNLRAYVLNQTQFCTCPSCQEWTVERTFTVLEPATENKTGKRQVAEKCQCCSYVNETVETVPRITSFSDNTTYIGDSGWGGGSDFGGGDSGGGGDGGGW